MENIDLDKLFEDFDEEEYDSVFRVGDRILDLDKIEKVDRWVK